MMRIWVDADACPRVIKEILFRAAERKQVQLTLVANQPLRTPPSPYIDSMIVAAGFDVADDRIVELLSPGDLVITADIPLAAAVIGKAVADTAHRLHQCVLQKRFQCLAQAAHVHVYGSFLHVDVGAPHAIKQLRTTVYAVRMCHQELQQPVFGRSEANFPS